MDPVDHSVSLSLSAKPSPMKALLPWFLTEHTYWTMSIHFAKQLFIALLSELAGLDVFDVVILLSLLYLVWQCRAISGRLGKIVAAKKSPMIAETTPSVGEILTPLADPAILRHADQKIEASLELAEAAKSPTKVRELEGTSVTPSPQLSLRDQCVAFRTALDSEIAPVLLSGPHLQKVKSCTRSILSTVEKHNMQIFRELEEFLKSLEDP